MSFPRFLIGIVLILAGLSTLFNIDVWQLVGPIVLIWIGIVILSGPNHPHGRSYKDDDVPSATDTRDAINETFVFTSARRVLTSSDFSGGKVSTVFSSAELDLTEVKTKAKKIYLDVVSVFGSTKIRIPQNWDIVPSQALALGSLDNRAAQSKNPAVQLVITGTSVLGSTLIVN